MKWNNFYSNNGSLLLVSTPLIFTDVNEIGFKAIPNSFRGIEHYYSGNYGFPKRQLFTEIQFVMGLKKEQFFTVTHRQVVNKHVSLAIDYRRIKSDGYLNRQTSEGLNFSASLTQKYANERYNIYARGYYEKIVLQENGGILDVAQVDNKSFVSKQLLDITLPQAKNYKQVRGGEIENRWNFGNLVEVKKDTVISKKVVPTSAIWHKIAYSEINRVYKDTLPGAYYERYYFDADSTNDKFFNFITENYLTIRHQQSVICRRERPDVVVIHRTIGLHQKQRIGNVIYCKTDERKPQAPGNNCWVSERHGNGGIVIFANAGEIFCMHQ